MSPRLSHSTVGLSTAVLATITLAGAANAQTFAGHVHMNDSYGPNPGGEFHATAQSDFTFTPPNTGTPFQFGPTGPGMFETFCLEMLESMDFTVGIFRADLNTQTTGSAAGYAGGAMGGFNDALDPRTAYLYQRFIQQALVTPYDYANEAARTADATAMQEAMWFIEQESTTPLAGKSLLFFNEANTAVNTGAWTGLGNVRVLNLYTMDNNVRANFQDVLVVVPAPAALALMGAGLLVMGRRRR